MTPRLFAAPGAISASPEILPGWTKKFPIAPFSITSMSMPSIGKSSTAMGHGLADYGTIENLLEVVSTYLHEVAGMNAGNVRSMVWLPICTNVAATRRAPDNCAARQPIWRNGSIACFT